jgi:hypothetical protein
MTSRFLVAAALLALTAGAPQADDKKPAAPDMQAMMAAMMKHATPGEHHKLYEKLVGKWTYTGQFFMGDTPTPFAGRAERKMILDGRFMTDHVFGDPPMVFEGMGWSGYDNHKKKYVYVWIDSMTTSLMTGEGTYDPATKTLTMTSEGFDPAAGAIIKGKDTTKFVSDDEVHHTFYKVVEGKEIKTMEMKYQRAK